VQTKLLKGNFADLDGLLTEARIPYADAILMDLGVSSPQIDVPDRGFSFKADAPLDMRMDPGHQTLTAAEVIATYDEADLARIFREYGEERWATRIAAFIVAARGRRPLVTTTDLVDVIKAAVPASARRSGGHPAKRVFQALRIEVNDELGALRRGLEAAIRWLATGGRIAVISYHSLEDRIVKRVFADNAQGCTCPPGMPVCTCGHQPVLRVLTRRAIVPSDEEIEMNPRARSAKLRVAEKR
jgi:16S rRNA (cytosine1402-N4)-methyltransferase